jgi:hypothetical protein
LQGRSVGRASSKAAPNPAPCAGRKSAGFRRD